VRVSSNKTKTGDSLALAFPEGSFFSQRDVVHLSLRLIFCPINWFNFGGWCWYYDYERLKSTGQPTYFYDIIPKVLRPRPRSHAWSRLSQLHLSSRKWGRYLCDVSADPRFRYLYLRVLFKHYLKYQLIQPLRPVIIWPFFKPLNPCSIHNLVRPWPPLWCALQ